MPIQEVYTNIDIKLLLTQLDSAKQAGYAYLLDFLLVSDLIDFLDSRPLFCLNSNMCKLTRDFINDMNYIH